MKTSNNPKAADLEAAVMPSFFCTIASRESKPLFKWEEFQRLVQSDPLVEARTNDYRKRMPISKDFAQEMKLMMPGITASVQMDGTGKELRNVVKATNLAAVDVDNIPNDKLQEVIQRADADPHVMARYITASGKGLRLLVKYQGIDDDEVSMLELFDVMIHKIIAYYGQVLGVPADEKCVDITRMCGIAYDPTAYFHWDAQPFTLDLQDLKTLYTKKAKKEQYAKRGGARHKRSNQKMVKLAKGIPSMDEAAQHIQNLLENQWGHQFCEHHHNEYMVAFGNVCLRYGINLDEVLAYTTEHFSSQYADAVRVVKQCYKHTERQGTWHFYRKGEGYDKHPSVKCMKQWLLMRYEFHHNEVTGFYEVRSRDTLHGKLHRWTRIDDNIENTLWRLMEEDGLSVQSNRLHNIINSDFSEPYDPLDEFLRSLPQWDGKVDYIEQVADRIHIIHCPGYQHTQERFRYYFKKWFVSMVVAWVSPKVVSQTILLLIGKGGIFKTTFFNFLLPPCLWDYYMNDSTACYTDKDYMEAFASKALLNLDEIDSIYGKSLSAFKSNMTKLFFSLRRPYDKYRSELMHRAALCGTSNHMQIINDEENRRYSPWFISGIVNPNDNPLPYQQLYAQAVALGKEVTERKKRGEEGWVYWLTADDIEQMQEHNKMFMTSNFMEDQILRYYRVPDEHTELRYIKFRYSAEIMERIGYCPALSRNLALQNLASVMTRLGFKKIHRASGNGWAVIEKEDGEQMTDAVVSPSEIKETPKEGSM